MVSRCSVATSRATLTDMDAPFVRVRGWLTTVNSEPRIAANLKAIPAGFCRFCGGRIGAVGGARRACAQAADATGEDLSDLVETFFGGEGVVGSHGSSEWKLPTATYAARPARCLAECRNELYLSL